MAGPYYWVLADGTWDNADTTNWSASDGGLGGAGPPLVTDDVNFTNLSDVDSYTVTMGTGGACLGLVFGAPLTGSITWTGSANMSIRGSITLLSGMTNTYSGILTLDGGGAQNITSNGVSFACAIRCSGAGTRTLVDDLTISGGPQFRTTGGVLDLNGQTLTAVGWDGTSAAARTITFNGGKIVVTPTGGGGINIANITNLTITDTSNVEINSSGTASVNYGSTGGTEARSINLMVVAATGISFTNNSVISNLDLTGLSGDWTGTGGCFVYGNLTVPATMGTITSTGTVTMGSTSAGKTITMNGKSHAGNLTFNGVAGAWTLQDDATFAGTTTLTNGSVTLGANDLTTGIFASNNANARTLVLSSGSKVITTSTSATTVLNAATTTNLTLTRSGGTIEIGGNTTNVRVIDLGAAISWPAITFTNTTASGGLDIVSSGDDTVVKSLAYTGGTAQTIRRTAGTTITIEDDDGLPRGTAGNLLTIDSITAAQHTWSKSGGGTVNVDYVTISNSNAEPADTFFAGSNSIDGGGNTGWTFAAPVTTAQGGGDSTRLRRRGRRPKYFWQQAIEDEEKDKIAEAVSDAVADAYLIESHREFAEQVSYLRNVEQRLKQAKFNEIAEQIRTALKDLEYQAEMRLLLASAQEEAELRELMEII